MNSDWQQERKTMKIFLKRGTTQGQRNTNVSWEEQLDFESRS